MTSWGVYQPFYDSLSRLRGSALAQPAGLHSSPAQPGPCKHCRSDSRRTLPHKCMHTDAHIACTLMHTLHSHCRTHACTLPHTCMHTVSNTIPLANLSFSFASIHPPVPLPQWRSTFIIIIMLPHRRHTFTKSLASRHTARRPRRARRFLSAAKNHHSAWFYFWASVSHWLNMCFQLEAEGVPISEVN